MNFKESFSWIDYPVKHWLITVFFGPLPWMIYRTVLTQYHYAEGLAGIFLLCLALGLAFSLPVFFLYQLAFNLLIKTKVSSALIKALLLPGVLVVIFFTFKLIDESLAVPLSASYAAVLITSSFFIRINNRTRAIQ